MPALRPKWSLRFAAAGCAVVSNSSALRMAKDVPLVIPEVNAGHVKLIESQAWRKKSGGFVVTNPNCSAIGLVLALAPLDHAVRTRDSDGGHDAGCERSGVSRSGIARHSRQRHPLHRQRRREDGGGDAKLLGKLNGTGVVPGAFAMSAQCNRVAVEDGHTESISVRLKKKAQPEEIIDAWNSYTAEPQKLRLPSAPDQPVVYLEANDRPQPRFDAERGAGMTTTVGRLRPCKVLDWKFTVLSHNTIRGAAGAALLNAELLKAQGYLG